MSKTILDPAAQIPVIEEVDVCVVGGSCTGVFAAIRAARAGARVAIIEKNNCFGGVATNGLVCVWHSELCTEHRQRIWSGLTAEVIERLQQRDAVDIREPNPDTRFILNTEELKIELDLLIREHQITPYLHTYYARPVIDDGRITAVVLQNKDGRSAIRAQVFIDASGDGDLAAHLDVPFTVDSHLQPPTTCAKIRGLEGLPMRQIYNEHRDEFEVPKDAGWSTTFPGSGDMRLHAETHVFGANTADARQWTDAEMEGRRHVRAMMDMIRKYYPERREQLALIDLSASIGVRETRRCRAHYQLTETDVLEGVSFDDAISFGSYRVDVHFPDGGGYEFKYLDGSSIISGQGGRSHSRWRPERDINPTFYQIPYRCMTTSACPNLVMAGRMIDADKGAYGAIRVMVNMNQTGEAAGEAAIVMLRDTCPSWQVAGTELRQRLVAGGSVMPVVGK